MLGGLREAGAGVVFSISLTAFCGPCRGMKPVWYWHAYSNKRAGSRIKLLTLPPLDNTSLRSIDELSSPGSFEGFRAYRYSGSSSLDEPSLSL